MTHGKAEGNRSEDYLLTSTEFERIVGSVPTKHAQSYTDRDGRVGTAYLNITDEWSVVMKYGTFWIRP